MNSLPTECHLLIIFANSFLSGLIWIQTVCKRYQQMTLVGNELKGLKRVSSN